MMTQAMQQLVLQQQQQQQAHHQQQLSARTSPSLGPSVLQQQQQQSNLAGTATGATAGGAVAVDGQQQVKKKTTGPIHNPRYKSILCDHWERNGGTCPYAEKCQFAHGPAELAKWQAHRARQQQQQQQGQAIQQQPVVVIQQAQPQQIPQGHAFTSPAKLGQGQQQQQQAILHASYLSQGGAVIQSGYEHLEDPSFGMAGMYGHPSLLKPVSNASTPLKSSPVSGYTAYTPSQADLYANNGVYGANTMASPGQLYQPTMTISPSQVGGPSPMQISSGGGFTSLPPPQYPSHQYQSFATGNSTTSTTTTKTVVSQPQSIPSSNIHPRSSSPGLYGTNSSQYTASGGGSQRQTPVGSLSSSPPMNGGYTMMNGYMHPMQHHSSAASRRSVSPDNESLELRSHQDLMDVAVPRSASDPRRTASLPQLFSKDFLASLTASQNDLLSGQQQQQQQQQHQSHMMNGGMDSMGMDTMGSHGNGNGYGHSVHHQQAAGGNSSSLRNNNNNNHHANSNQPPNSNSPPLTHYPSYRRGCAPPVVLSVVTNSLGDYNSLADLDSLADELVSEPATSASQLFNMPTVFPGSIKGSINEYL